MDLRQMCLEIVHEIEDIANGKEVLNDVGTPYESIYDYLSERNYGATFECYDDKSYLSCKLIFAGGGPTIEVDCGRGLVIGYDTSKNVEIPIFEGADEVYSYGEEWWDSIK